MSSKGYRAAPNFRNFCFCTDHRPVTPTSLSQKFKESFPSIPSRLYLPITTPRLGKGAYQSVFGCETVAVGAVIDGIALPDDWWCARKVRHDVP